jgi:SAM-dependent methyltransferase
MSDTSPNHNAVTIRQLNLRPSDSQHRGADPIVVEVVFEVVEQLVFDLDVTLEILSRSDGETVHVSHLRTPELDVSWLPRGTYRAQWCAPGLPLPEGDYALQLTVWIGGFGDPQFAAREALELHISGGAQGEVGGRWSLEAADGSPSLDQLSWRRGHDDWFFRHFDHAARTIISFMLGDSPLLKGRILDVGCGDGITDLGVFLRCRPEKMVGIDPFAGFNRLNEVLAENHLPLDALPEGLEFHAADGNHIPYPDDSFDVVLSWGSLEHIAGGYLQTLREIKRVLKDGGLFFAHPGLYYSNFGHHIGEFTDEPFVHLTHSHEEIREIIFNTPPRYMDRAGEFSPPEDYWRWFNELNPMTVAGFEQELRALDFEFYRAAIRTEELVEYHHPALQKYSMQDLATVELYLSAWNRKSPRPADLEMRELG